MDATQTEAPPMRRRFVLPGSGARAGGAARRRTPEYQTWSGMLRRCYDDRSPDFARYGARGISVCERWRSSFEDFLADVGAKPPGCTLDRRDNALGYEPGNVRWATPSEQARNRRSNHSVTANGETLTIAEWSERTGIRPDTLLRRLRLGWTPDAAVSQVVAKRTSWKR
jgi:hypothetical protein